MFAPVRLLGFGFLVLTVIYISLSLYSRAVRKEKLEEKWLTGPQIVDRDTFVKRGLAKYDGSVRRKLILGVYVVPVVAVGVIIYLTNFS